MHLLGAENISLEYPTKPIFDSVTLGINEGDRVGVVGRNGDGKSTLMSILAGRVQPDSGRVTMRRGVQLGYLNQADVLDPDKTVVETVVGNIDEHEWAGNAQTRDVIDGLLSELPWDARVSDLSGGQRRRVALAALLVGDHDVIFLDEPTNHLDVEGVDWLARHLKARWNTSSGGLVVVTHDRWFLDEVSTTTWEVHDQVVEPFEGGYAAYVLQRVERDRMAASSESKRQNLMRKELAWLRRGPPARTSKPKFRIKAAEELIANDPPARDTVGLSRMAMTRLGKDVIDIRDASVSFGDKEVLKNINWNIAPGERAGLLGINGAGKSTLLNLITGALTPTSGAVKRGKTISVATLTQHSVELEAMGSKRVREILAERKQSFVIDGKETSSSVLIERLGFSKTHLSSPINELSGGQKRRLQLLLILMDEPNVLVMDEPSNDLDTEMLAAIEDLLDTWPGTLVVVSHDRYLLERVTDQQYAIMSGHFTHLPGGVEQYVQLRRGMIPAANANSAGSVSPAKSASALSNADRQAAGRELASVEKKLQKVPAQIERLETQLQSHDQADYEGLVRVSEQLIALKTKASELESRWLELTDQLEPS